MTRLNTNIYRKSNLVPLDVAKTNLASQPENTELVNTWLKELSRVVHTTARKADDLGEDMGKVRDCFNDLQGQLDTIQRRLEEINRKIK
jgi:hypothetical protein